jgi:hypothetical protein
VHKLIVAAQKSRVKTGETSEKPMKLPRQGSILLKLNDIRLALSHPGIPHCSIQIPEWQHLAGGAQ